MTDTELLDTCTADLATRLAGMLNQPPTDESAALAGEWLDCQYDAPRGTLPPALVRAHAYIWLLQTAGNPARRHRLAHKSWSLGDMLEGLETRLPHDL